MEAVPDAHQLQLQQTLDVNNAMTQGGKMQKASRLDQERDKKRLKRLLRNRVSAQQARERKKNYVGSLEAQAAELQSRHQSLEAEVNKLRKENEVLRQILQTTSKQPQST
eukprot:jgi/Mesvir1/15895/Mv02798-RA.1